MLHVCHMWYRDLQQHHHMHLVRNSHGGDIMYVVFDFKQKFLSKGFCEEEMPNIAKRYAALLKWLFHYWITYFKNCFNPENIRGKDIFYLVPIP